MASKLDRTPVGKENDGRRKISDQQKLEMHKLYRDGVSIYRIAKIIGCSKRSVQFELFPERKEHNLQLAIKAKRWQNWNTKEIRREVMRKYRAKKKRLFLEGKLTIPTPPTENKSGVV